MHSQVTTFPDRRYSNGIFASLPDHVDCRLSPSVYDGASSHPVTKLYIYNLNFERLPRNANAIMKLYNS